MTTFEQWMHRNLTSWERRNVGFEDDPDKVTEIPPHTAVWDRSEYVMHGRHGDGSRFATTWHHPVREPPDWNLVLSSLRGDMASIDDGFANWEHGFDTDEEALVGFQHLVDQRSTLRRTLGWAAYMDLFDCEED